MARSRHQVAVATKAYFLSYLLDRGFTAAIFFDADILVLDNLQPLFDAVEQQAILLTPHLLAPLSGEDRASRELNILLAGTYNAGFLAVSEDPATRSFLAWWQDRLYQHCCHAVQRGMHHDQHWLDLVPVYFDGVRIFRDPAYNVAYWRLPERDTHVPENLSPADTRSFRFFHFSGFDPEQPRAVTRYSTRLTMENIGPAAALFDRYAALLNAAGYSVARQWPYAYGCFDNGVAVPPVARRLYLALADSAAQFGDPFRTAPVESYFHWLNQPVDVPLDPALTITHLWRAIYEERLDVRTAYPEALDANREGFVKWAASSGVRELDIHASLVPLEWKVIAKEL